MISPRGVTFRAVAVLDQRPQALDRLPPQLVQGGYSIPAFVISFLARDEVPGSAPPQPL
jgi:hypothetical protein